ncbi:Proteasome assembly chaperone 3 protein [Rutstroemia sp. NJR-2017a BBW]|nr:Proteasome assembly chaperone 3 protein [Rutstroemia sp. NJR-2017a BBW]
MTTSIPEDPTVPNPTNIYPHPFPAPSKQVSGLVSGIQTDVSCLSFADKIVVTISQGGRLGQWISLPLTTTSPTAYDTILPSPSANGMILPLEHLTPKTMLGAGGENRERIGHLYATQIGSMILQKNPEERRTVMVGLGLEKSASEGGGREGYFDLLELIVGVL